MSADTTNGLFEIINQDEAPGSFLKTGEAMNYIQDSNSTIELRAIEDTLNDWYSSSYIEAEMKEISRKKIRFSIEENEDLGISIETIDNLLGNDWDGYNYDIWKNVYETVSIEDLETIYEYVEDINEFPNFSQIIECLLCVSDSSVVELTDIMTISDRGAGADAEKVENVMDKLITQIDPVIAAFTLTNMSEVTTNRNQFVYGDYYRERDGHSGWILQGGHGFNVRNFAYDQPDSYLDEEIGGSSRNVVAHEFGHLIHRMFGLAFPVVDQRNDDCNRAWNPRDLHDNPLGSFSLAFREEFKNQWDLWEENPNMFIDEYQRKTPAEFFATTFEFYINHGCSLPESDIVFSDLSEEVDEELLIELESFFDTFVGTC